MSDFSPSGLFAALIFGAAGLYVFRMGKKRVQYRLVFLGLALMIYPYFTKGPWMDWGVGFALCGLAYYIW